MTNAPTTVEPEAPARVAPDDVSGTDPAARGPLLLLLGSGIAWLVISGVLALVTSIQLHSPHFLAEYAFFTYGRAEAMRESAFVYGWLGNAGLAVVLWVLGRLGGQPLRAANWVFGGALFWNLGLTAGLVGIGVGDLTSFPLFQLPRYVQPLLVIAYGAIGIAGVLAWMGRRARPTFASQWYAVAALFLFPWLSSLSQVILLWLPMRGVGQAIGAGWYAQGALALWLSPMALAGAYYLVPRLSGRVIPNYESAPLGFWSLVVLGAWTGGRHLIGGPVPAWVSTVAIVAVVLLLLHFFVVGLNLRAIWGVRGTAAGFIRFGLVAYVLSGLCDALTSFRGVAETTQFTLLGAAIQQLGLYGAVSMFLFAAVYFMVPRLTGHAWISTGLTVGHRLLAGLGIILVVVTLAVTGGTQGEDLLNPKTGFTDMFDHMKLSLLMLSGGYLVLLGANVLLLVNFLQTVSGSVRADVLALNPVRGTEEVVR